MAMDVPEILKPEDKAERLAPHRPARLCRKWVLLPTPQCQDQAAKRQANVNRTAPAEKKRRHLDDSDDDDIDDGGHDTALSSYLSCCSARSNRYKSRYHKQQPCRAGTRSRRPCAKSSLAWRSSKPRPFPRRLPSQPVSDLLLPLYGTFFKWPAIQLTHDPVNKGLFPQSNTSNQITRNTKQTRTARSNPTDVLQSIISERTERGAAPTLEEQRQMMAQQSTGSGARDLRISQMTDNYMRQMPRRWKVGDVYAPKDLSPLEMKKWKSRQSKKQDIVDLLGFNPIDNYKACWGPYGQG